MSKKIPIEVVDSLRDIVETIVAGIVDHPDDVEVIIVTASFRLLVELHTNSDDVGQVIGQKGSVAIGIRAIMVAFGGKHGIRVDLDYVTEHEKDYDRRSMTR